MLIYGVDHFTYQDVINIINGKQKANLDKKSKAQIQNSYQNVQKIVKSDKTVYGINTGFGPLCDVKFPKKKPHSYKRTYHFAFCRSRKTNC
jgi:histidine ammonia-lyase